MAKKITAEFTKEELTFLQSCVYYRIDVFNDSDIQRNMQVINKGKEIINKIKQITR